MYGNLTWYTYSVRTVLKYLYTYCFRSLPIVSFLSPDNEIVYGTLYALFIHLLSYSGKFLQDKFLQFLPTKGRS